MPETVIAVPVWDTDEQSDYTIQFVEQCLAMTNGDFLLVVINNASPSDRTNNFLASIHDPRFRVVWNKTNRGYGTAANQGIAVGFNSGCDYGIVLNNDIVILDCDWMNRGFLDLLREDDKQLIGARVITDNGLTDFGKGIIPYAEGWGIGFHRFLWGTVGGFDDGFHVYFEDVDLSYRVKRSNFGLTQSPAFHWVSDGHISVAHFHSGPLLHLGGRTGYAPREDFNWQKTTLESAKYFRNKFDFPKLPTPFQT